MEGWKPKPKHNWQPTERQIPGGYILKLHACTVCKEPHVKAYDMIKGLKA